MVTFYCSENSGKCQDREGRRTLILRRMQPQFYSSFVGAEVITTFDLRMTSPNEEPVMNTAEMHAIEHLGATFLRNHGEYGSKTIYFGPMGPYRARRAQKGRWSEWVVSGIHAFKVRMPFLWFESRSHLRCRLDLGGREIFTLTSHYGLSQEEIQNAVLETLRLAGETELPLIFMGDLNEKPDSPLLAPLFSVFSPPIKSMNGQNGSKDIPGLPPQPGPGICPPDIVLCSAGLRLS